MEEPLPPRGRDGNSGGLSFCFSNSFTVLCIHGTERTRLNSFSSVYSMQKWKGTDLGPTRHVYSDWNRRGTAPIARRAAASALPWSTRSCAQHQRRRQRCGCCPAAPRTNPGAAAKGGTAFGWGRVDHHRVPPPGAALNPRAWGAPRVPRRLKGVTSSTGCCFSKRGFVAASSDTFDADDTIRFND